MSLSEALAGLASENSTHDASSSRDIPRYASTKLIAYLGNKRALLPFLLSVFGELDEESPISRFLDPFAGSGAVSRLARSLGWAVMACDSEEYSRAVNEAWLGVSSEELPLLFAAEGGLDAALAFLNDLHPERSDALPGASVRPYISAHYAPASTAAPDWRRERLFYTRENAVFLDRARCAIEDLRPTREIMPRAYEAERALMIGLLVYEAATHANTSGVFKAYHKGFGGHGRDALGRILSPMRLEPPLLWGGPPSEVRREEASSFCAGRSADLCYLDPPYNQHQYGSNYHLLNTIARWDRPPVRDDRTPDGSLLFAAGIPPEWRESRSAFCSRSTAAAAFRGLIASIDARIIALSYNTEGLVSAEELFDILGDRAEVRLRSLDYVKYRGGRQSASRRCGNSEILFVARRREGGGRPAGGRGERAGRSELADLEASVRLSRALAGPFDPAAFRALCAGAELLSFESKSGKVELGSYRCLLIDRGAEDARLLLDTAGKSALADLLEGALLPDNAAACAAATGLLESGAAEARMQDLALGWLRKLAHRGYEADFRRLALRLGALAGSPGRAMPRLAEALAEVEALFAARLAAGRRYAE